MLNIFNLEKQAGRRIKMYLMHKAAEHQLELPNTKLVINNIHAAAIHLYGGNQFVETLKPKVIAEFFGKDFEDEKLDGVSDYLRDLSVSHNLGIQTLNIVICENKNEIGAFLFDGGKHIKKLSLIEILSLL